MSLVERCKTKYQKRKVLYNLAGVMALTFAVATNTRCSEKELRTTIVRRRG